MLSERKELIEKLLAVCKKEAASMYLQAMREGRIEVSTEYDVLRIRIANLEFDLQTIETLEKNT